MPKVPLCSFGKQVRRSLDEINETQSWLIERVRQDTGKYFDSSYLYKTLTGRYQNPLIIQSICRILNISYTA